MDKCEFCGQEEARADINHLTGLTWLWPDEMWICSICLKEKKRHIINKEPGF